MSIARFFTITFTVRRHVWSNESSSHVVQGTFLGHLQQARLENVTQLGLTWTKTFSVWCAVNTDVEEGDEITANGVTYSVRAKQLNNYGNNEHAELLVERHEEVLSV